MPVYDSLTSIYTAPDYARYAAVGKAFEDQFGAAPEFYVRAPGRVNIIGTCHRKQLHVQLCSCAAVDVAHVRACAGCSVWGVVG